MRLIGAKAIALKDKVLELVRGAPGIVVAELMEGTGESSGALYTVLYRLMQEGLLVRNGKGTGRKKGSGFRYFASRRDMLVWELSKRGV